MWQIIYSPAGFLCFSLIQLLFVVVLVITRDRLSGGIFLWLDLLVTGMYTGVANRWGYDTIHYYIPYFNGGGYRVFEPGFALLIDLLNRVGVSVEFFPVLIIVLSVALTGMAIRRIAEDDIQTGFILFCLCSMISFLFIYMGGMRQAMSTGLIMFSLMYLYEKKTLRYYIALLAASSFHFSALIFLLYPLWHRMSWRAQYGLVISGLAFALISGQIIFLVLRLLPGDSVIAEKIIRALNYSDRNTVHAGYAVKYILSALFLFIPLLVKQRDEQKGYPLLLECAMYVFFFSSLFYFSKESSIRYLYLVNILLVIYYVPFIHSVVQNREKAQVFFMMMAGFLVYGFFSHRWLSEVVTRFL